MALKKIDGGVVKHIECEKKCGRGWLTDLQIYEDKRNVWCFLCPSCGETFKLRVGEKK
jgi:hypothetical protein